MVEDEFEQRVRDEMLRAERPRGILTEDDRKYLMDKTDIQPKSQTERDTRRRIRKRIFNAILDFYIIDIFLERRDLDEVFGTRRTGEDIDSITREGIHALVSFLYYAAAKDEQTLENWIKAGLRHTALREAGIHGDFKEPSVQLEITPPVTANLEELSEKIEQERFDDLNTAEIEFLLQSLGPLIDYPEESVERDEIRPLQEALEEYYTGTETEESSQKR